MNRWKRGDKLYVDMKLHVSNAEFWKNQKTDDPKYSRKHDKDGTKEEKLLQELIQKANARLKQIEEDKN